MIYFALKFQYEKKKKRQRFILKLHKKKLFRPYVIKRSYFMFIFVFSTVLSTKMDRKMTRIDCTCVMAPARLTQTVAPCYDSLVVQRKVGSYNAPRRLMMLVRFHFSAAVWFIHRPQRIAQRHFLFVRVDWRL